MSDIIIPERLPTIIKLLGGKWKDGPRAYRMKWGELSLAKRGMALDLISFEDHFSLHVHGLWMSAFITLRFLQRWHREPDEQMISWGFSLGPDIGLHLHFGARTKIFYMPWRDWVQTAHDVRRVDGSWVPFVGSWEEKGHEIRRSDGTLAFAGKEPDRRHKETYPYRYLLRSGEWQERTATIYVERRTRKLRWLRRLPFGKTSYAISVTFSDEVGERTGSWKGGTIGCGYELRENETPRECLLRMERERKF